MTINRWPCIHVRTSIDVRYVDRRTIIHHFPWPHGRHKSLFKGSIITWNKSHYLMLKCFCRIRWNQLICFKNNHFWGSPKLRKKRGNGMSFVEGFFLRLEKFSDICFR